MRGSTVIVIMRAEAVMSGISRILQIGGCS